MRNCTPEFRISRSILQTNQFIVELGISVPSLRTCIPGDRSHLYKKYRWWLLLFLWSSKSSRKPLWQWSFTTRLTDYYFDKTMFPSLRVPKASLNKKQKRLRFFSLNQGKDLSHLNPHNLEWKKWDITIMDVFHLR